jgi:hypothetical protein
LDGLLFQRESIDIAAHQRMIREEMIRRIPRTAGTSLNGYAVETISRDDALPIILHYEWLGSLGKANYFVGLLSPNREIEGVACFGHGPAGDVRNIIGSPALCLERGACVHYAPPNAASFLINAACKLISRAHGIDRFFAYGDPSAGEYGAVYQAAGWAYLGQGLDGKRGRRYRFMVLPPGRDANDPANWKTTREFRRGGRRMSFSEARELGWQIAAREAKHVYATHVGRDRKAWRKGMASRPYPAPRPHLKGRSHAPAPFTIRD